MNGMSLFQLNYCFLLRRLKIWLTKSRFILLLRDIIRYDGFFPQIVDDIFSLIRKLVI